MSKITEKQIIFEAGTKWVLDTGKSYAVMLNVTTHSVSDSEYPHTNDGLSIAIARCKYLDKYQVQYKLKPEFWRNYAEHAKADDLDFG